MTTHRVRIAVLITQSREWDARGWGYQGGDNEQDDVLESELRGGSLSCELGARVYWIEAGVPVPDPAETPGVIEGTMTEADHG